MRILTATLTAAIGATCLLSTGCVVHRHHHRSPPGHVHHPHMYRYYPECEVYFHISSGTWHWHDGNKWHSARALPGHRRVGSNGYVEVNLDGGAPRSAHLRIKSKHPGKGSNRMAGHPGRGRGN